MLAPPPSASIGFIHNCGRVHKWSQAMRGDGPIVSSFRIEPWLLLPPPSQRRAAKPQHFAVHSNFPHPVLPEWEAMCNSAPAHSATPSLSPRVCQPRYSPMAPVGGSTSPGSFLASGRRGPWRTAQCPLVCISHTHLGF